MGIVRVRTAMRGSGEVGPWDVVGFQNKTDIATSSFKPTFGSTN